MQHASIQPCRHRLGEGADLCLAGSCKIAAQPVHVRESRAANRQGLPGSNRSEEHTSELQSLMRISYAVFCLKKKKIKKNTDKRQRIVDTSMNQKQHIIVTP